MNTIDNSHGGSAGGFGSPPGDQRTRKVPSGHNSPGVSTLSVSNLVGTAASMFSGMPHH